jgi:hypothetical protein
VGLVVEFSRGISTAPQHLHTSLQHRLAELELSRPHAVGIIEPHPTKLWSRAARLTHKPVATSVPMANSTSPVLKQRVTVACVQLASGPDKAANLSHAREKVHEAANSGAKIVVLPECFNSPYGCNFFPTYAETLLPEPPSKSQSPSYHALSAMAAAAKVYLVGGSLPELDRSPTSTTTPVSYLVPMGSCLVRTERCTSPTSTCRERFGFARAMCCRPAIN